MDEKNAPGQPSMRPANGAKNARPIATPGTDPTNPHNQESVGDWVAAERAAERHNAEPGLTDDESRRRKG
jgi:hypothetical protein